MSSSSTASAGTATAELQHLISSPPNTNCSQARATNNPHAAAHAVLQELRDSGDPQWLFLRTVLEHQHQQVPQELLFHCISGSRHVLLTNWMNYSSSFLTAVRDLFMYLGFNDSRHAHVGGNKIVRMAYFTSSVAIWKRQWADQLNSQNEATPHSPSASAKQQAMHPEQEQHILQQIGEAGLAYGMTVPLSSPAELFQFLSTQMTRENHDRRNLQVTSQYISSLVGEFSGKSAVVAYSLPLEFHKEAYRLFETASTTRNMGSPTTATNTSPLDECLRLAMTALSSIVNQLPEGDDGMGIAQSIIQVTIDVIGWEFGGAEWMHLPSSRTLIRPPEHWSTYLMRPDFIGAVFGIHDQLIRRRMSRNTNTYHCNQDSLVHDIRQLLLSLCSLTGPIFRDKREREFYAHYLCEGSQQLLTLCAEFLHRHQQQGGEGGDDPSSLIFDTYSLLGRLISNFRLAVLSNQPTLIPVLEQLRSTATLLLQANVRDCESVGGDVEMMEDVEWRNEALSLVLEVALLLCQDPWLKDTRTDETSRRTAQSKLTQTLGPLYGEFVSCNCRMVYLQAGYLAKEGVSDKIIAHNSEARNDTNEENDEIEKAAMQAEMVAVACLGRLHLPSALSCMGSLFQAVLPKLQGTWQEIGPVTPDIAALLEESRLMVLHMGYLLTDGDGIHGPKQRRIPPAILWNCTIEPSLINEVASLMQALMNLMEAQVTSVAGSPNNPRSSAALGKTFLWFLARWTPAYLYQALNEKNQQSSDLSVFWAGQSESSKQVVGFSVWLCMQYATYWSECSTIQRGAADMLEAMAMQSPHMRAVMVQQPIFQQLVLYHCVTVGIPSSLSSQEQFENAVRALMTKFPNASSITDMVGIRGYHKLAQDEKSKMLTALLLTCCDDSDNAANAMFVELLKSVESTFSSLVQNLSTKQGNEQDSDTKAMVSLCIELFSGVVRATTPLSNPRIRKFISPCLPLLSGLMAYYADDIAICERLLNLFCDYPSHCGEFLDLEQRRVLFQAAGNLLKSYSSHHCTCRVISPQSSNGKEAEAEEDKAYNDILCAITMLANLGRVDASATSASHGDASEVSWEVVFFGLQQIIPLMTQGLLQYPSFCHKYFSLVGFAMRTHCHKISMLPYELLDALFESLLYGISHHEKKVAETCLESIENMFTQQLKSGVLNDHLAQGRQNGRDFLDSCSQRIFKDLVYSQLVWDRLEATSNALLVIAAVDLPRFVAAANSVTQSSINQEQQQRLQVAHQKLLQHDVLSKVLEEGYQGRHNRQRFKESLEEFVNDVHSFLMVR